MERVVMNQKLIILLVFVLIAAAAGPVHARMPETTNTRSLHSTRAMEAGGRNRAHQVVPNTKEVSKGGIPQGQFVAPEKKEACIKKGYPCEPYAKCCNSCVVDPIYGFYKCS